MESPDENLRNLDGKPIGTLFKESLQGALDRFRCNGLTVGEAMGAIELLKLDLYTEMLEQSRLREEGEDP